MLGAMSHEELVQRAAELVRSADALLVTAGAGMGVDSGLPDFRGAKGFWRAYPAYEKLGLNFSAMANPRWFQQDPEFAWGFYGHRLNLYRRTVPHEGFSILRRFGKRMKHGAFVFTSNVDGQFQRASFHEDRIVEAHGSIHHVQCLRECGLGIGSAEGIEVEVDETSFRAKPPLPACPRCKSLLRPNILMFGDWAWDGSRSEAEERRLEAFLSEVGQGRIVVIECGAGTGVPTVRFFSERIVARRNATLIRINVREPEVPAGQIGIALGALEALRAIETYVS